jgi:hypothetical protein
VEPEASSASSPSLSPDKHGKLTGSLWCINYLWFFNHNPQPVILCMIWFWDKLLWPPKPLAAINPWYICYKWFEKRCEFSKENAFQNVYDEGFSPLSPCEWDDQGLPSLGEGRRWWLSWFRREQKDCPLIYGSVCLPSLPVLMTSTTTRYCMGSHSIWTRTVQTPGLWRLGSTRRIRRGNV